MGTMLDIIKKLQRNFGIVAFIFIVISAHAEPCKDCIKLHSDLANEQKIRESYVALKAKNEDYLKNPAVPAGAAIKVRSNLMLIGIKIETQDNKIEAINIEKKKLNDCATCPMPNAGKS